MSTYINVARYHLVQRRNYRRLPVAVNYVTGPWTILGFAFAVTLVIIALSGGAGSAAHPASVGAIYVAFFACGVSSTGRSLPFGLSLGLSRRSYYLGTVMLAVTLAAVNGLALAVLAVIERATGGWGMALHVFRVSYTFDGPPWSWYLTWLTSFVVLTLLFVYGMWLGLVYLRWELNGIRAFIAAQALVLLAGALVAISTHAWHTIGHFLTALTGAELIGLLAALTAAVLAGGFATIRRVTV